MTTAILTPEIRSVGRKPKTYKTKQVRLDEKSAALLQELAGLMNEADIPDLCHNWLVPILEAQVRKVIEQRYKELQKKIK